MDAAKVVVGVLGTVFAGLTAYNFRYEIGDLLTLDPQPIVAEIQLDNRCDYNDSVFVVRDLMTDKFTPFYGGNAILQTVERNRVRLEFNPKYKDVEFFGTEMPVHQQMVLIADCRNSRKFVLY